MNPDFLKPQKPPEMSLKSHIIEFFETLVVCFAVGSIIYWQVARPHQVSGLSMYPTFHDKDFIITNEIIYKFQTPQRGQVIVFKDPDQQTEDFIKRIIGLPGDTIELQNGRVLVNGKLLEEPYINSSVQTDSEKFLHEGDIVTVPKNQYFVLGDNRENSSDSRFFGFVDKSLIVGEAFFRYWPKDSIGIIPTGKATLVPNPQASTQLGN